MYESSKDSGESAHLGSPELKLLDNVSTTGFIQASMSKFKDFSWTSKSLSNSFQGLKVNEIY